MIPFPMLYVMAIARAAALDEPFDVAYGAIIDWYVDEMERAEAGWFNTAYYCGA